MVQIGTIEYEARVTGVDDAQESTDELQESQEQLAETTEESAGLLNRFAGTVDAGAGNADEAAHNVGRMDTSTRLLGSSASIAAGAVSVLVGEIVAASVTGGAAAGALGSLKGAISGLTIGGIVGGAIGSLKGFASWLAAGSAGALAFAGALGFGLGVLGVWALEVTGAIGKIRQFGQVLSEKLPGWARDGLITLIGIFAGPLAAIGSFIVGTIQGGFKEGINRAKQTLSVFQGAWNRTIGRIKSVASSGWNTIASGAQGMKNRIVGFFGDLGDSAGSMIRSGFNAAIPSSLSIPEVTIGGGSIAGQDIPSVSIGGGSINMPQLQTGGMIEQSGAAVVHEGEAVIPEPIVSAASGGGSSGGGGGGDVTVDVGGITLEVTDPNFDPSDLSRRDVESLADRIARILGKKTSSIAGTR